MPSDHIGTLSEKSLHAQLKDWYTRPGDQVEAHLEGYVIDILRPKGAGRLLIEIQTGSFSNLKIKFANLLAAGHPLRLLHPIPSQKWILRQSQTGDPIGRRKSPRRGRVIDAFRELVYLPHVLDHPGFSFEVLLIHQEEIWRNDGQGSWRRKGWSIHDQQLLYVVESQRFSRRQDYLDLIPVDLPDPFTNRQLAETLNCRPNLAQKMTYTLFHAGMLERVGRKNRAIQYARSISNP